MAKNTAIFKIFCEEFTPNKNNGWAILGILIFSIWDVEVRDGYCGI